MVQAKTRRSRSFLALLLAFFTLVSLFGSALAATKAKKSATLTVGKKKHVVSLGSVKADTDKAKGSYIVTLKLKENGTEALNNEKGELSNPFGVVIVVGKEQIEFEDMGFLFGSVEDKDGTYKFAFDLQYTFKSDKAPSKVIVYPAGKTAKEGVTFDAKTMEVIASPSSAKKK